MASAYLAATPLLPAYAGSEMERGADPAFSADDLFPEGAGLFRKAERGGSEDDDDMLEDIGFFGGGPSTRYRGHSDAQQALNELGITPSSPFRLSQHLLPECSASAGSEDAAVAAFGRSRSRSSSNEVSQSHAADGVAGFDLDHELDMEEEYMQDSLPEEGQAQQMSRDSDSEGLYEEVDDDLRAGPSKSQSTGGVVDDADDILESNGLLSGHAGAKRSLPDAAAPIIMSSSRQTFPEGSTCAMASTSRSLIHQPAIRDGALSTSNTDNDDDEVGLQGLPRYIPIGSASAILLDGSTARFERRKRLSGWKPRPAHYGAGPTGLLSRPVHQIVDRIEAMAAEQVVRTDERRQDQAPRLKSTTQMWQERYRPSRFTELVGEERTHREVMGWLKEWDVCVYGRRADKKRMRERQERIEQQAAASGSFQKAFVQDKYHRPRERVLLLGGPAGMGKTTLAHVAAQTCGYAVHEINASDDRSAKTVEDRVREALESRSLQSSKPTCLVLDEVDGATGGGASADPSAGGGGFVKALIKLLEGGGASSASSGKRKNKQRPLLRPIVCVCNDPYSASLRALRPYAKMVRLNRPSTAALLGRLRQICERERIHADTAGLNMLIEMCQGDVRSCLNALQLLQSDPRGVTPASLQGSPGDRNSSAIASAMSMKDGNASVQQVWSKLLRSQTARERDRQRGPQRRQSQHNGKLAAHGAEDGSGSGAAHDVVSSIINSGEMDKIIAGCFEHYPNLKLVDDGWWRFKKAHDWMYWYEHLNQRGWELGNHTEMWGYLPWSFVCWRLYFANTSNELPEYPRIDYQQHLKKTAFDEVAHEVFQGLPPSTRTQFDRLSLVTELGPMLTPILTPDLKPINSQLIRPEEKATLASVVSVMDHTNVTFALDKNEQGHSYYRFDPPLEVFSHFEGKRAAVSNGPAARFNVRQMLASELRAKRVRDRQVANGRGDSKAAGAGAVGKSAAGGCPRRQGGDDNAPAQPKPAAPKAKVAVDFFGRPIVAAKKPDAKMAAAARGLPASILASRQDKENGVADDATLASKPSIAGSGSDASPEDARGGHLGDTHITKRAKVKVFYHYHEGYSNAVRKPIKMSALLS